MLSESRRMLMVFIHLIVRVLQMVENPCLFPVHLRVCIELLHKYGVAIKGKKAVVIGGSMIVGTPARLLLEREGADVETVHSKTSNPEEITRTADILIVAAGKRNLVRGSWIKPGSVVIDVGINKVEDSSSSKGYKLVGDVCYEEVIKVASALTPVPGGVGPMTIAMLLLNTLIAARMT